MADTNFRIGQFRRDQIANWDTQNTPLTKGTGPSDFYDIQYLENPNIIDTKFYDFNIVCNGSVGETAFSIDNTFYIKFAVPKIQGREQDYIIELRNDSENEAIIQELKEIHVDPASGSKDTEYTYFSFIFTPNNTYRKLCFRLQRIGQDYREDEENRLKPKIEIKTLKKIGNIITYLQSNNINQYPNLESFKKIGIQGPPGLMFSVNGEEMVINRTGIYELYHEDILITFLGFLPEIADFPQDINGKDFFILDFRY